MAVLTLLDLSVAFDTHHHHHQSFNREGRWGTTDDFATSFLHFSRCSTALWDLANSRPVHSLMLFPHLFLCLPCLLLPSTDTIDHYILLHRLQFLCGISGTVLSWLESYLTGRTRTVTMNDRSSRPADVSFGVPWGSVLGPILFFLYSVPLYYLIQMHSVSNQSFADDTQLLHSCPHGQIHATVLTMQTYISDVKT